MTKETTAREQAAKKAEDEGFVVIDRAELEDHYAYLRELVEGLGMHKKAAETAIAYLFDELG
jgi:hypothetical protein